MFLKLKWLAIILIVFSTTLSGKEKARPFYPVAAIDSSLRLNAGAVCREYRQEFELFDNGRASEHVHLVVSVLNRSGDVYAELELPYDKTSKITSISGSSYDAAGMRDDRLKNSNIQDLNYTSEGTLYDDLRLKTAKLKTDNYPYTVEFDYEITYSELIGYPEWRPISGYRFSVEKSSFTVSCPDNMDFRYREFNLPQLCRTETHESGIHHFEWKLSTLKAWREEPLSQRLYLETPRVITAPVKFTYCGYSGSMNSWDDFGKWHFKLLEGRDQLPAKRQEEIRDLVKELKDTAQIVRKLYEYMQSRTHYVGIQMGIGGYQPFPAETVDHLGYGDCKALSNYMKALLNAVGITSDYTIAGTGYNQGITMTDFPTVNQCNHAILCVPLSGDTIWLECTSQTSPCGYLSTSTAGRKVLTMNSRGSRIVNTPLLTAEQSSQCRSGEVKISPTGSIEAVVKTTYAGYQYNNISQILTENKQDQEKALYEKSGITGLVISGFSYEVNKIKVPQVVEKITLSSPIFTSKTGSRLFIPLNIFNQMESAPARVDNRTMAVYRQYAYLDKDSVLLRLPVGFKVETLPHGKTLNSEFGAYCSTIALKDNQVLYQRKLKMNRGIWPKEKYNALIDFYAAIINADKVKLVLKIEAN